MGVKSTTRLTRQQAEEAYIDFHIHDQEFRRKLRAEAAALSNQELADKLEEMNDKRYEDGGYDNYVIVENGVAEVERW